MKNIVIIDTNGLMIPGQFGLDIFSELEQLGYDSYIVAGACVRELEKVRASGRGKDKMAAKLALSLLSRCTIIEENGFADDAIFEMAIKMKASVLTNDAELKKRLCSKGVTIVYLRDRTRLVI
ncbi:MAG: DNA-binding protein [Candidatus Methanoperedens sp.]|nr:DNA-binding protein [Candidatus Methanoperedens sp.]